MSIRTLPLPAAALCFVFGFLVWLATATNFWLAASSIIPADAPAELDVSRQSEHVNLKTMFNDYKTNEYAAHLKYKGKYIQFGGTIMYVAFYSEESVSLTVNPWMDSNMRVVVSLSKEEIPRAAKQKPGNDLVFVCREDGLLLDNLLFKDCQIL